MRRSNAVSAPRGQSSRRSVPGSAASSRPASRQRRGEATERAPAPNAPPAPRSRLATPEASMRDLAGVGLGVQGSWRGGLAPSSPSQSSWESIRRAVTPSARQWWIRITSAVRPTSSGPTTSTHQSGRSWSRRSAITLPTNRIRASRSVTGSDARRTWLRMSKLSSSTHAGAATRRGVGARRWRARGRPPRRASTRSLSRSTVTVGPSGPGSAIASFIVCPAIASDSRRRIRVSSALSRSMASAFIAETAAGCRPSPVRSACY